MSLIKSVANAQRNWAELSLAKTFAKTSGTRQSVIGHFFVVFSRRLIGQLSFLLIPNMVHGKMNVHKHRTKQTYESNKFQYLKSFCLNTSFTFSGGCRPSLVYLYMISPIRSWTHALTGSWTLALAGRRDPQKPFNDYSQLSLRQTPLKPVLSVRLREMSVL